MKTPSDSSEAVTVNIDVSKTYQTIDNFGASDAWSCQFIGNWPEAKKNAIADLLFSMDTTAEGAPQGIGLSLWRFNVGAGSSEQGNDSGIGDEWRRAASFLTEDGSYDWNRQAGQQWFLQAAKQRGVQQFLIFPNSPPVQMTKNRKAFASGGVSNLAPEQYDDFCNFLAKVIQGIQQSQGITFDYVSPVNEPQWDWSDGGQEGNPYTNEEIAGVVKALNTALEKKNLSTKIDIAEAGKINYLYATEDKPNRGEQITAFFKSDSPDYLGALSHVGHVISAHSYFTTSPYAQATTQRKQLATAVMTVPDLKFWMSEYCILGDNAGEIDGGGRDLGMTSALYVAKVIYQDLAVAHAAAWQWWLAVSPYDYKDGLVYVDKNKTDGQYEDSKMLWAMGNYSRFIRPGAVQVDVQQDNSGSGTFLVSSFLQAGGKQLITVVVNLENKTQHLNLQVKNAEANHMRTYITAEDQELSPGKIQPADDVISIAPRSVTTVVSNL